MAQKLRIPVATLLTKVEAFAKANTVKVREATTAYESAQKAHRRAVVEALREEASRIAKGGKHSTTSNYNGADEIRVKVPEAPKRPAIDVDTVARDLAAIRSTDQDSVLVDASDSNDHWGRYL